MDGGDTNLLTLLSDILGSQHGGVWGRLISVSLDLHTTSDSADGFPTGKIGHVDESIVERSEDTGNSEDKRTV